MKKYIVLITAFLLLITTVHAIRISPAAIDIPYEPGYERDFQFITDVAKEVDVFIMGDSAGNVTLVENNIAVDGTFVIKVKLSDEILNNPGTNRVLVGLMEKGEGGGMVSGVAAIRTPIDIKVPYNGIFADVSFRMSNMNEEDATDVTVSIQNIGNEDIKSAKAKIDILNYENQAVETLLTDEVPVPTKKSASLKTFFNASKHAAGDYTARATVTYDENEKVIDSKFRIGSLKVLVNDHTKSFFQDTISKFDLTVESAWNDEIKELFARVEVSNETGVISSFKTVSVPLKAWEKKTISTFWDPTGLALDEYDVAITLEFMGQKQRESGTIVIVKTPESQGVSSFFSLNLTTILIVGVIILIFLNILVLLRKKK